jgi:hypothetical protein
MRIRRAIERRGKLEDAAAAEQQRLLAAAQREILAELRTAGPARAARLRTVLATVTRFMDAGRSVAGRGTEQHVRRAWSLGIELADAGIGEDLYDLSEEVLRSLVRTTRDLVRDTWGDLGTKLKGAVRRTVLGLDDPQEAMKAVAKVVRDPRGWSASFARAENLVRDRVNATFSTATQERFEQAAGEGVKVRKYWLNAHDDRVRPDHVKAGQRYTPASAIPFDKPFIVGGEALMQPLDPQGSPEQTRNCRCVSVPVVVD